MVSNEQTPPLS